MNRYLFTSPRMGFRNWADEDLDAMAAINASEEVMRYFPSLQDRAHTAAFISRMQAMYEAYGYCYFALERLADGAFIGFTGLAHKEDYIASSPYVDIGWRLAPHAWGQGYATEAATQCLQYGFDTAGLPRILAVAPKANTPSIRVMQKAGMEYMHDFAHPLLKGDERLEQCVLYGCERDQFRADKNF